MEKVLAMWNYGFHDGVIKLMEGRVPGDIRVTIKPGLGSRKYFQDPGDNFVVLMRNCSVCMLTRDEGAEPEAIRELESVWEDPSLIEVEQDGDLLLFHCVCGDLRIKCEATEIYLDSGSPGSHEELIRTCDRWWEDWRKYWDSKRRKEQGSN